MLLGLTTGKTAEVEEIAPDARMRGLRFIARIHRMRTLGWGLGVLSIASVLYQQQAPLLAWIALLVNGYVWPHMAWLAARRSRDPARAELRSLVLDSVLGGAWIAMMQFNLLPSALLAVMLSVDKIGVAGWRFLARTAIAQVLACAATSALLGFPVQLHSSMLNIVASLPFLFGYPMAISTAAYALGRRVLRQNRMLEHLNRIDDVTGLFNRRHWEEVAGKELARCLRTRRPAVVMMIDVDDFKQINDRHGHVVGDAVLRCVADVLKTSLREIDTPARYGGDEFCVLLAETRMDGAREVAERLRAEVEAIECALAPQVRCTVSIGLAEASRVLVSVQDWVNVADIAMYQAKHHGRNRAEAVSAAKALRNSSL
ncbi:diguanylate cyclase [Luteimonas cucumeris]|uniref:diguanylate cyclase n=1 Tax=Luteimonas cucumeris TaxID=985012 RepID=A0A562LA99_9GAMM|nr:diguanylate cyclase [Luteimonas cucumeris]TWI04560.1 diguanylate cyclase [Luteimonas cucumeris]